VEQFKGCDYFLKALYLIACTLCCSKGGPIPLRSTFTFKINRVFNPRSITAHSVDLKGWPIRVRKLAVKHFTIYVYFYSSIYIFQDGEEGGAVRYPMGWTIFFSALTLKMLLLKYWKSNDTPMLRKWKNQMVYYLNIGEKNLATDKQHNLKSYGAESYKH
jgi:hypothetical protein